MVGNIELNEYFLPVWGSSLALAYTTLSSQETSSFFATPVDKRQTWLWKRVSSKSERAVIKRKT
jgi:hypothetical protein